MSKQITKHPKIAVFSPSPPNNYAFCYTSIMRYVVAGVGNTTD